MLKIVTASLFTKNKRYAGASKINGASGNIMDGYYLYNGWWTLFVPNFDLIFKSHLVNKNHLRVVFLIN